jgi:hypothetical protein
MTLSMADRIAALEGRVTTLEAGKTTTSPPPVTVQPTFTFQGGLSDTDAVGSIAKWSGLPVVDVSSVPSGIIDYRSGTGGHDAWYYLAHGYTPNSAVKVTLCLNEPAWDRPNQRVQDVYLNGSRVVSSLDIYALAGAKDKAVNLDIRGTADAAGDVKVGFSPTQGTPDNNTYVCGVVITGA